MRVTRDETTPGDAELLSALMDDELTPRERDQALERLQREPALQARWARYHAVRAALDNGAAHLAPDFAERVRRARENEPVVFAPRGVMASRADWVRPLAGIAIAASVALVAIGGLTLLRDSPPGASTTPLADGGESAVQEPLRDSAAVRPVMVAPGTDAVSAAPEAARKRLLLYLASHNEYADMAEVPTGIPYGRLGSLNAGQ